MRWIISPEYGQTCCVNISGRDVCDGDLLHHVNESVVNSSWFQRYQGRDHVLVASHWGWPDPDQRWIKSTWLKEYHVFTSSNTISFEDNGIKANRLHLASTYWGYKCTPVTKKTSDVAMIASLHPELDTFQTRRNICNWLADQNSSKKHPPITSSGCGEVEQCPALAEARIGIHARGDTWGSNRLMDTLLSGTVPAFTGPMQYVILPFFIPWRKMSVFINVTDEQAFFASLREALHSKYKTARDFNRDKQVATFLDWQHVYLFEHYMAAFASFVYDTSSTEEQLTWPNFTRMDGVLPVNCSNTSAARSKKPLGKPKSGRKKEKTINL